MRRSPVCLCVFVAALVTAVVLLRLGELLTTAPTVNHTDRGDPAADAGTVRRFYAALDAALAAGDAAGLDAAVWPEFAVARTGGEPWDLAAFRRHLLALHAAQTGLALRLADVAANDRGAVALVALEGAGAGGWLGVPEMAPTTRLAADRLRVAGGRVVAYAGIAAELSPPHHVIEGDVQPPPALGPLGWGLARVRLAPGAALSFFLIGGPVLYAVEAGELALRWDGTARIRPAGAEGGPPPREVRGSDRATTLRPGDQVLLAAGTAYEVRNAGTSPATALAAALLPRFDPTPAGTPGADAGYTVAGISGPMNGLTPGAVLTQALFQAPTSESGVGWVWPDGVAVTPLAAESLAPEALPGAARLRLTVDRLILTPGARGAATLAGPTVLAVEAGRAIIVAAGGRVTALAAGEAASYPAGGRLAVHDLDAAPLVVLALTLTPAETPDPAGTPAA